MRLFAVIAIVAALCGTSVLFAQSIAVSQPNDYGDSRSWLCRPGRHDACDVDLTTTIVAADGALRRETRRPDPQAPIDCFYVYPTVSTDSTSVSDMNADLAELNVARLQFARFAEQCRLYAPIYRQVTLAAGRLRRAGGAPTNSLGIGYDDVLNAWNYYLQHENQGRGVVLIGHSQGSSILRELIRKEIDGKAVQSRLVSALLLGLTGGLAVPRHQDVGGTFQHVLLCRIPSQTGCVITYSSFRSTVPPPADTLFGKVEDPKMEAACTNPAALEGGEGALHSYFDTAGRTIVKLVPSKPWVLQDRPIATPWVSVPGLLTARCTSNKYATYLEVTVHGDPSDPRADDIPNAYDGPGPNWGLHGMDAEGAMGNLVDLVGRQAKAFLARSKSK